MNKNLFIYSFKYLAVLLALVTFSSCERDEFTEQNAFDLNEAQLNAQYVRDTTASGVQDRRVKDMAIFRANMERLARLNSGGKVFYTVNVVPGGSSAFSSGRFEEVEGLTGVEVTVAQFGNAVVDKKMTDNGLAVFELYSGEVTVSIKAPNHTDLNYTANLTPDGGVPNGAGVYVGNVVPVFDLPSNPAPGAEENFAIVKGFAFAETDITYGNNFEESVPDSTTVRAFIDVANPAFKTKYIDQANDEGTNIGGNPTKSGFIQRFAYEQAASTTGKTASSGSLEDGTSAEGGEYSIMIGGTASGLPIQMKFDDFAADRTYYFDDSDGDFGSVGVKRFLYTQNTEMMGGVANADPTPIGSTGASNNASRSIVDFSLVQTDATATATLTGGDAVTSVSILPGEGGYYYVAPEVTFSAPTTGTTATGVAVLGPITAADITANPDAADAQARGLQKVVSVTVTSGGSGYTSTPSITFTRFSYTGRVAGGAPVANGTGEVAAPSSTVKYIRIMDAGFGMNPAVAPGTAVTGVGAYTGVAPAVVFNGGIVPAGGALATANTIVDTQVGTATEIQVTNGGDGYTDAVAITFNYGSNASVSPVAGAGNAILVVGAAGDLRWNTVAGGDRNLIASAGEVVFVGGSNYTFVPSVNVTGLTVPAGASLPTFVATVTDGIVTSIEIQGATSGWGAANTEFNPAININANPDGVNITAQGFTTGGSIDSYDLINYGVSNDIYKSSVEDAGETFNYLTTATDGSGTITNDGVTFVAPADYADNSDFIVVFENPTAAAGDNAWGYPIFDNSGNNVVGVLIMNQGIGYTNASPATYNFWLVPADLAGTPKAALAKYAQTDSNPAEDANVNATVARTAQRLTITFTDGGLGYAVRPEFILSGGNRSVEDLAGINSGINATIRPLLNFDGTGRITNTTINYTFPGASPFTAAGIALEPIEINPSMDRLEGIFNMEANKATSGANAGFKGGITVTASSATEYNNPAAWWFYERNGVDRTSVKNMFNQLEMDEFTGADRVGTGGAANADFKYISAPTYEVWYRGVATGGEGSLVLEPGTADIIGFDATALGSIDGSFIVTTNDESYSPMGERFRTIGGASKFEVFSGLTYIRDVNYGTGIELE